MKPLLNWADSYSVGHAGLDADHRHLIDSINEVQSAMEARHPAEKMRPLLERLALSTEAHFHHENTVLEEIRDSVKVAPPKLRRQRAHLKALSDLALGAHILEHRSSLIKLVWITRVPRTDHEVWGPDLCANLRDWFLEHAIKYDADLKTIFQAM